MGARLALNQLLGEIGDLSASLAGRTEIARAMRDEQVELLGRLRCVAAGQSSAGGMDKPFANVDIVQKRLEVHRRWASGERR